MEKVKSSTFVESLLRRRSPRKLGAPGPSDMQLHSMIGAACNAPDHGRLKPWRFVIIRDAARLKFGNVCAEALRRRDNSVTEAQVEAERAKFLRAPVIVAVGGVVQVQHKVPIVEQLLAVGAAAQNLVLAAHAMGFGVFWRTGNAAYSDFVKSELGLASVDSIVGFLYIGTIVKPGIVVDIIADDYVTEWTGRA